MPSKTRKPKKQRFNRRKSRKIGGANSTPTAGLSVSNALATIPPEMVRNGISLFNTSQSASTPPPPVAKATALENNKVQQPSSVSAPPVRENVVKSSTEQLAPTVSAASSASVSTEPPASVNQVESKLQQSNDPLCQLNVGDLVQYDEDAKKILAYVISIDGGNATLSDGTTVEISKLQKYQYQDILLSLSRILQFVLENKENPKKIGNEQKTHIEKINSIKQNLEAVQNKLTPQGST